MTPSNSGFVLSNMHLPFMSRMDALVIDEAVRHGMHVNEVRGTRSTIANLEGVIFEITLN